MWDLQLAEVARSKPIYPALVSAIQTRNNKTKQQQLLVEILGVKESQDLILLLSQTKSIPFCAQPLGAG